MSEYKRLTNKYWKEHYDIFEDACCDDCDEDCGKCEINFNALVRLAELEDKIENRTLVEFPFCVFDKKKNKEADCYKIALKEDWAKCLCYCDMEGFAITQDGMLILLDECGRYTYCPDNRFKVVAESELKELQEKQR